jgi:NAD(P)-dependent dehydrogenase (short-subunit alcohol dehydrogenase family)
MTKSPPYSVISTTTSSLTTQNSASGLGQACVEELVKAGGYVSILDMNEENGADLVSKLGSHAKFFVCDVLETESIKAAVDGTVAWTQQTGAPLGGVIPAAGVSTPATVCSFPSEFSGNVLDDMYKGQHG